MQQTPNVVSVVHNQSAVNNLHVFERAGYRIRNNRADCPSCEGHARLTVAIHGDLFFCHRCHRGGNVRELARSQGLQFPQRRLRLADLPKKWFRQWLSEKSSEMAQRERRLYRQASYAHACLQFYPQHEGAWEVLRELYSEQRRFQRFWGLASDRIGRFQLYRWWRREWRRRAESR